MISYNSLNIKINVFLPSLFRQIRNGDAVDDQEILKSFVEAQKFEIMFQTKLTHQMIPKLLSTEVEKVSEHGYLEKEYNGKMSYLTPDERFIIQIISKEEKDTLLALLPDLSKHATEKKINCLLDLPYGLYEV
jgi:hypothetical protein